MSLTSLASHNVTLTSRASQLLNTMFNYIFYKISIYTYNCPPKRTILRRITTNFLPHLSCELHSRLLYTVYHSILVLISLWFGYAHLIWFCKQIIKILSTKEWIHFNTWMYLIVFLTFRAVYTMKYFLYECIYYVRT